MCFAADKPSAFLLQMRASLQAPLMVKNSHVCILHWTLLAIRGPPKTQDKCLSSSQTSGPTSTTGFILPAWMVFYLYTSTEGNMEVYRLCVHAATMMHRGDTAVLSHCFRCNELVQTAATFIDCKPLRAANKTHTHLRE